MLQASRDFKGINENIYANGDKKRDWKEALDTLSPQKMSGWWGNWHFVKPEGNSCYKWLTCHEKEKTDLGTGIMSRAPCPAHAIEGYFCFSLSALFLNPCPPPAHRSRQWEPPEQGLGVGSGLRALLEVATSCWLCSGLARQGEELLSKVHHQAALPLNLTHATEPFLLQALKINSLLGKAQSVSEEQTHTERFRNSVENTVLS